MTRRSPLVRALALLAAAGCLAAVSACGPKKSNLPAAGSVEADKYLFDHGNDALAKKRWLTAREYFKKLVDTYPQSQYRQDAKLGIGDSFLGENTLESNILAANEFKEFLTYYPLNPRADYAQYKIGVAHFKQMLGAERDQTETREALKEFDKFLQVYPNSPLRAEVEQFRRQTRDRLSEHEYRVGLGYLRQRWLPGAIFRFKTLLETDPQYTGRDAVYYYLGEALYKAKSPESLAEALAYYARVPAEFQKSEYLEKANKRIAELKR
jgi:outer membrane protein assembly factor BamD